MDPSDDRQVVGLDVRLPPLIISLFRADAAANAHRPSRHAEVVASVFLACPGRQRNAPVTSTAERRLTFRLRPATHAGLTKLAAEWGVTAGSLLRLVIEEHLQRTGQL